MRHAVPIGLGVALLFLILHPGPADMIRRARLPRGIRNNNPGNIERTGTRWRGMAEDQSADPRFIVFESPLWGLRAIARVLRTYRRRGIDTVRSIIARWAPPHENPTEAYIAAVAARLGKPADAPVTDADMIPLMEAIVQHENGVQPYDRALFAQAAELERQA